MNFDDIVEAVPDYPYFLTSDELDKSTQRLALEYPEVVSVFEAGTSRKGHAILCMKIGSGSKNALCFACPHPNEPIGAMTMEYFSRALAENAMLRQELDYTWYIIKCIDPDGLELNEGWFKGPFNIYNYSRNYYRPAGYEQVEWTFPIDYKELHFNDPLPETQTVMRLIDELKPAFIYSLHNAGFGGAYWYLSTDIPDVYDAFYKAADKQGVVLSLGEPEAPYATEYAPGIFEALNAAQIYDYLTEYNGSEPNLNCGTSGAHYAATKCDGVTFMTELPYFFDPRIADLTETSRSRRDVIREAVESANAFFKSVDEVLQVLRPHLSATNPFLRLVNDILQDGPEHRAAQLKLAENNEEFQKPATVSQEFDRLLQDRFYNGLALGMIVRAFDFEIEALQNSAELNTDRLERLMEGREQGEALLRAHCADLESKMQYTVIPIQKLVRIQLECGLAVADYLDHHTK